MTLLLVAIVGLAFTVEAAVGFGSTLIALALGSLLVPIDALLPAFVPLNVVLSIAIVARAPRKVAGSLLARRVLPAMAFGFPIGLLAFAWLPAVAVQRAFAGLVFVLAALELGRVALGARGERAVSRPMAAALLVLGGALHGAFASGGPPVVYVCARTLPDKARFRATMSALWLVSNLLLVGAYAVAGRLEWSKSAMLAPGLLAGLAAGSVLHGRIPERAFRTLVFALLLVVAVVLAVRA